MSITSLLTKSLTIIRRSTSVSTDDYGNQTTTSVSANVLGEIQQVRRAEPGEEGELSVTDWMAFLPAGTDIDTGDQIVYANQKFEVVGDPWDAATGSSSVHHVEATLKRTAGAGDLS